METEKNRFSQLLEQLMNLGEIKNAALAKALQYDVSYISKWVSGRMLPAEKKQAQCAKAHRTRACAAEFPNRQRKPV